MAKKKSARRTSRTLEPPQDVFLPAAPGGDSGGPETTGRYIVIFKDEAAAKSSTMRSALSSIAGVKDTVLSSDFAESAIDGVDLESDSTKLFEGLGIAVISGQEDVTALATASSDADSPILAIEPEYVAYTSPDLSSEYLRGYRDAINHLFENLSGGAERGALEGAEALATFADNLQLTWGLQATLAGSSRFTGHGIKVAVLDTGFDFAHPDFLGRPIERRSFVAGVTVQDVAGHGTHCVGTACGPLRPASGVRRYGCATAAHIHVGKVFNNAPRPSAPTSSIIAGVEWATISGCAVVSLSLGAAINQKILQYDVPMQRALNAGTLVVAAAGNNANRPANVGFVEPPAYADAALAVAAVNSQLGIAPFSSRSSTVTGVGGRVNIAGPGVQVFSSVPVAQGRHASFNGTSMATPHVAGIAALWAQATGLRGAALANKLLQSARAMSLPSVDVGSGLVQAPQ